MVASKTRQLCFPGGQRHDAKPKFTNRLDDSRELFEIDGFRDVAVCLQIITLQDIWPRVEPLIYEMLDIESDVRKTRPLQTPLAGLAEAADDGDVGSRDDIIDTVLGILGVNAAFLEDKSQPSADEAPSKKTSPPWVLHIEDDAARIRRASPGVAAAYRYSCRTGHVLTLSRGESRTAKEHKRKRAASCSMRLTCSRMPRNSKSRDECRDQLVGQRSVAPQYPAAGTPATERIAA